MECKRKTNQSFEVRVRVAGGDATNHDRLRFALLTSRWVPKPAGVALWSALHVLLIVGSAALWVSLGLFTLEWGVFLDAVHVAAIALHLAVVAPLLFILSLLRLSWALMRERERARQIRWACGRFVEWWKSMLTPRNIADGDTIGSLWTPSFTWEVLNLDAVRDPVLWRMLHSWCEEVVHVHDAISI